MQEAVRWFIRAARQGDKTAQHNLGVYYAMKDAEQQAAAEAAAEAGAEAADAEPSPEAVEESDEEAK
jgi:TPR repeat protein